MTKRFRSSDSRATFASENIWKLVEKPRPADYEVVWFKGAASDMTEEKVKNLRKAFNLFGVFNYYP